MDNFERSLRTRFKNDFEFYARRNLKISTKAGGLEPLILNHGQRYIHVSLDDQLTRLGKVRAIILKGRQMGCSTYIAGRYYWRVTHSFGKRAFIMAHEAEATNNLFAIAHRYHENNDPVLKPQISKSNAKELKFGELDSGYKLGTAENKKVGRSSTIHYLHGSEVAFWENAAEHAAGIMQAVPDLPGTEIILESTANGVGGFFFQMWQEAEAGISEYLPIFVPWFWQPEYRKPIPHDFLLTPDEVDLQDRYMLDDEQIMWRRNKILDLGKEGANGELKFNQEYPNTAAEAFILSGDDNYIGSECVARARKTIMPERHGVIILGVDPARFGQDRTCMIRRQNRVAYGLQTHSKINTMQIVAKIIQVLETEPIDYICIDVGGLGAGVYDRLIEIIDPRKVFAVNSGSAPMQESRYRNKRAEMWHTMKEWLTDEGGCQIPDSDELQSDLINVKYTIDSNSRLLMESKENMKKRGVRSSDAADALAFTFALPKSFFAANVKVNEGLELIASASAKRRQLIDLQYNRKP